MATKTISLKVEAYERLRSARRYREESFSEVVMRATHLRDNGNLIGANDLWIAATGLAYEMPVVTRNVEHFKRVPGLEVESY